LLEQVGFEQVELEGKTGFDSSPKTEGSLIRGKKPIGSVV
jgi:hypothetical protein